MNDDGRHSKHLSILKKCSHLRRLRCLEQLTISDIVSTAKLP